jgi:hypothetical protein
MLHRQLLESTISDNPNCFNVWVHLLLRASHKAHQVTIGRQVVDLEIGQILFGRKKFSAQTGITENCVRSSLEILKTLKQITIKSTTKYSVITVSNWHLYQGKSPASSQQIANRSPADNQQAATYNNGNNGEKGNNKDIGAKAPAPKPKFIKPTPEEIHTYLLTKKIDDKAEAETIFDYYESKGWVVGKAPMKSWKSAVNNWIKKYKKPAFGNNQPYQQNGNEFRPLVCDKTENTPPPAGLLDQLRK